MDDPRHANAIRHRFCDIIVFSLLCFICDRETVVDMEDFGKSKEKFHREFLELPYGTPSYDTYSRFFRIINPADSRYFFYKFRVDFTVASKESPAIAIDGKELRRSFNKAAEQSDFEVLTL